jgi:hypothetical protein
MARMLLITIGSKQIMQIGPYSSTVRTKERWSTGHFLLFILSNLRNKSYRILSRDALPARSGSSLTVLNIFDEMPLN